VKPKALHPRRYPSPAVDLDIDERHAVTGRKAANVAKHGPAGYVIKRRPRGNRRVV